MQTHRSSADGVDSYAMTAGMDPQAPDGPEPHEQHRLWELCGDPSPGGWTLVGIQKNGAQLSLLAGFERGEPDAAGHKHMLIALSGKHKQAGEYKSVRVCCDKGEVVFEHHLDPALPVAAGNKLALSFTALVFPEVKPDESTAAGIAAAVEVETE